MLRNHSRARSLEDERELLEKGVSADSLDDTDTPTVSHSDLCLKFLC